jgi:homogentisate 1,2-dioxygenase
VKRYITFPHVEGRASRQAHADMPEGTYEREISKEGFFGPAAHLHHRNPPTGWVEFEGPLRPHAFDLASLAAQATLDPWQAHEILHNAAVRVRFWRSGAGKMARLARNADGDDLLFVHRGEGDLYCDFGHLSFAPGDYLLLPRGTMWRVEAREPLDVLMIEATNSGYKLPDRGLLGPHALFDPAMLELPRLDDAFRAQQGDGERWQVRVKRRGALSTITYPFNPLDAVGWHGDLCVARLNVKDIRPVASHRYHLPPSAHSTFVGERFVVCTFVPRPFETDPGALKVPFFHSNDDFDEMLFYHAGITFIPAWSRCIRQASLTARTRRLSRTC